MSSTTEIQNQEPLTKASEEPEEYLIWARDRTYASKVERTVAAIRRILDPDARIERVVIYKDEVSFWLTTLSPSQVEQVGKLEGVSFLPSGYNVCCYGYFSIDIDYIQGRRSRKIRTPGCRWFRRPRALTRQSL